MHEIASSPAYEQDTVASSTEDADRALPAASVSGQARAQSLWRVVTAKAEAEESSDKAETIAAAEKIMMISVDDRALGEVRGC